MTFNKKHKDKEANKKNNEQIRVFWALELGHKHNSHTAFEKQY